MVNLQTKWIIGIASFIGLAFLTKGYWMPKGKKQDDSKDIGILSTPNTAENAKKAPALSDIWIFLVELSSKSGKTLTDSDKQKFQKVFDKWSDSQKSFSYDYLKGFSEIKKLIPNSKEWNEAFTKFNKMSKKKYGDIKSKLYLDDRMRTEVIGSLS